MAERQTAGEQSEEDHSERMNVGARVDRFRNRQHLLGTHVGQRSDELTCLSRDRDWR